MREYTTTNTNPFVDRSHEVWAWEIPIYLFLGGLVAGLMIITGYFLLRGRWRAPSSACYRMPGVALVLLSFGMLALFLDLEHKLYVWRLYVTFEVTSPMSWGSWILIAVYPALLAAFVFALPESVRTRGRRLAKLSSKLQSTERAPTWIGAINIALGIMVGIYTGILLSSLGARPLWSSSLLGPLFLVSGISTAAALVDLLARQSEERELVSRADIGFLLTEVVLIALFFIGLLNASAVHQQAAELLLGGPYTAVFWVFVVVIGLLVPIVIQVLTAARRIPHTAVAPVLVLTGGLVFRFVIVNAGQLSQWAAL